MKGQNAKNFLQLGWRLCVWFFIILAIQQVLEKYHAVKPHEELICNQLLLLLNSIPSLENHRLYKNICGLGAHRECCYFQTLSIPLEQEIADDCFNVIGIIVILSQNDLILPYLPTETLWLSNELCEQKMLKAY